MTSCCKVIANAIEGESTFDLDPHEEGINSARAVGKERAKVKNEELFAVLFPVFFQHQQRTILRVNDNKISPWLTVVSLAKIF